MAGAVRGLGGRDGRLDLGLVERQALGERGDQLGLIGAGARGRPRAGEGDEEDNAAFAIVVPPMPAAVMAAMVVRWFRDSLSMVAFGGEKVMQTESATALSCAPENAERTLRGR